jgi:Kdo2-lipid IVA lauroyltransferase/acyltransferase
MAADQSMLTNWTQYLAARAVTGFMGCFSIEENLHTADVIGSIVHRFNRSRRERTERHIARSFPEWSPAQVEQTALRSMQHMFRLFMVESMVTPRLITPTTWTRYVQLGDVQPLLDLFVRGEPAIFITGHVGNWELLGCAIAAIGYPMVALARPVDNPLINDWLLGIREARGLKIVTKWGATPILQETLASGGRLGFIADQNAGDGGLFVPFFGRLASSYKSIALLAMRHQVPVVAGFARRLGDQFKYELSYTDLMRPEDWVDQPDPLFYITARYNRAMETMIRAAPDQYLWLHRRWKSRPKFEREGKAMPSRLIAKLEQLPWMTQRELDDLRRDSEGEGVRG